MSNSDTSGRAGSIPLAIAPGAECNYLPLSALNDLLFCERRCALHRIENIWINNVFTLEGVYGHQRADKNANIEVRGVRAAHAVLLKSDRLRLVGKADVVEFYQKLGAVDHAAGSDERLTSHGSSLICDAVPYPIEYKRAKRRQWDNDDVQLCAQALCLEEMLGVKVPAGAVFHINSKRRREIAITPELRARTEQAVRRLHELVASGVTPPAVLKARCRGCSLYDLCMPELLSQLPKVADYCRRLFVVSE